MNFVNISKKENKCHDHNILRINDEQVTFNVFKSMKYSFGVDTCFKIDAIDQFVEIGRAHV